MIFQRGPDSYPPPLDLHRDISTTKLLSNAINMYANITFYLLMAFWKQTFSKYNHLYSQKLCSRLKKSQMLLLSLSRFIQTDNIVFSAKNEETVVTFDFL